VITLARPRPSPYAEDPLIDPAGHLSVPGIIVMVWINDAGWGYYNHSTPQAFQN